MKNKIFLVFDKTKKSIKIKSFLAKKIQTTSLKKSNISTAIVPSPVGKPGGKFSSIFDKTEDEWNVFGQSLSSYVKVFEDNGITLGYHNHSFEFNPLPSGKMPIECILDHNENLKFEIE